MNQDTIHETAAGLKERLVKWRRDFHQNPELELDCFRTASIVAEELERSGFSIQTGYAKTGIVASIGEGTPVAAFRVDMDALPIEEETGLPFASAIKGVMHACGHDGHTAIGLGVAHLFSKALKEKPGKLVLFFQPGEEFPGGAEIMIAEGALVKEKPDTILGMHIFPDLPAGKIGLRYGVMTAAINEFAIEVQGRGGHGAYPHKLIDPFPPVAALINALQTIVSRNTPPLEALVISLGEIRGGASHNVVPGIITLKGTMRTLSNEIEQKALSRLDEIAQSLETAYRVKIELKIKRCMPTMECDHHLTRMAEKTLADYFGQDSIAIIGSPSLGGDDFSHFACLVPAVYLRLGCYDSKKGYINPLHTSRFDFDEDLLVKGVEAASVVLSQVLFGDNRPERSL